jgi:hypothetical protein
MRIAEETGLPPQVQADLYHTLFLKDAGCSGNSSRLYHILNADDIRAKDDLKTTDWTRVGWESLHYALTHAATGDAFLLRVWRQESRRRHAAARLLRIGKDPLRARLFCFAQAGLFRSGSGGNLQP